MIKALFFDIDGTLVGFRTHRMTDSLKECLYELRAKGVKLFISSGRHILVMNNLEDFPFDGYIAMNGAMTVPLPSYICHVHSIIIGLIRFPPASML